MEHNISEDEIDAPNTQQCDIWNEFQEQASVHNYLFSLGQVVWARQEEKCH